MGYLRYQIAFSKDAKRTGFKFAVLAQGVLIVALLASLGVWQLDRATEKAQILNRFEQAPMTRQDSRYWTRYANVTLSGHFLPYLFLLDNRTRHGASGYEVIAVMRTSTEYQLVNLGWTPAPLHREKLPEISLPAGELTLTARADRPSDHLVLGADHWAVGWPKRIQQVDIERIESQLDIALSPWLARASEAVVANTIPNWQPVVLPPERHQGYAVQWFGLAVVWCIGSIYWLRVLSAREEHYEKP